MKSRVILAAGIVLVVAATAVFADDLAPDPIEPSTTETPAAAEPMAGSWVCGVGKADGLGSLHLRAARPGEQTDDPSELDLARFSEGQRSHLDDARVFSATSEGFTVEDDLSDAAGTLLTWQDGPTVLWREWALNQVPGLPDVTIAGSCARTAASQWVIPGLSTVDGDSAILRLSNPYATAANVAVSFLTPDGQEQPLALENLTVPAASVREVDVTEYLPEEADLSAFVQVASGRVSVEGAQFTDVEISEIAGGSLLAAASQPSEDWVVPWIAEGAQTRSWLWVANPSEQTAAVELTMLTEDGGNVPQGLSEVSVPPGQMRRVDLAGTFGDDVEEAALAARSNGVPVVVSGAVEVGADDTTNTGLAVQLGAQGADSTWVVGGRTARARNETLRVANPTAEPASIDVAIYDGTSTSTPVEDLSIPAGSSHEVEIDGIRGDTANWTAFVHADEGEVVVGRVGTAAGDGRLRLIAAPAVPSSQWAARPSGLAPVLTPQLVQRLRTGGSPLVEEGGAEDSPDGETPDDALQDDGAQDDGAQDDGAQDGAPDDGQDEAPADEEQDDVGDVQS